MFHNSQKAHILQQIYSENIFLNISGLPFRHFCILHLHADFAAALCHIEACGAIARDSAAPAASHDAYKSNNNSYSKGPRRATPQPEIAHEHHPSPQQANRTQNSANNPTPAPRTDDNDDNPRRQQPTTRTHRPQTPDPTTQRRRHAVRTTPPGQKGQGPKSQRTTRALYTALVLLLSSSSSCTWY